MTHKALLYMLQARKHMKPASKMSTPWGLTADAAVLTKSPSLAFRLIPGHAYVDSTNPAVAYMCTQYWALCTVWPNQFIKSLKVRTGQEIGMWSQNLSTWAHFSGNAAIYIYWLIDSLTHSHSQIGSWPEERCTSPAISTRMARPTWRL